MRTVESQENTATALERIAWSSARDHQKEYHSLMHHMNVGSLRNCYNVLDGRKAVGVDGVNKQRYGENLQANLEKLIRRMKQMGYRPGPVRQVLIPKEGKPNATRPLGVSNFEDKLVQKGMQGILESIYDPIFLDCSYGFRPKRGCHDAIRDLQNYLFKNEVEIIIDVDISNYFGTIDRKLLKEMLKKKIKDTKFLRYIERMFKAGILSEGELKVSDEGIVQGSCCSPVLVNIYAHYVIDEWIEETVKKISRGPVQAFRFADDQVICCRYEQDAKRIKAMLSNRLAEFKLKLNDDKTKMVTFSKRKMRQGYKQETFHFLGFTFYLGKSRNGVIIPKINTEGKRLRAKLKKISAWAREIRNQRKLKEIWKIFGAKIQGHIQYYGVSQNIRCVNQFLHEAKRLLFKWLNRRSQRRSFTWEKFQIFMERYPLPKAKVCHHLF